MTNYRTPTNIDAKALPDGGKLYSTYLCDCIDEHRNPVNECLGNCWEWQLVDLEESIRDWWLSTTTNWFDFTNLVIEKDDGTFVREDGSVRLRTVHDVVDFFTQVSNDFSIWYQTPEPSDQAWGFLQHSPYETGEHGHPRWAQCTLAHSDYTDNDLPS